MFSIPLVAINYDLWTSSGGTAFEGDCTKPWCMHFSVVFCEQVLPSGMRWESGAHVLIVYIQCDCDGSHFSYDRTCQFSFGILIGGRFLGITHFYCCCGCFPRKTPGGVFLTLVKTCATAEQKKEIFQVDKEITARRVKKEKKGKANKRWKREHQRELAVVKQKAEWGYRYFEHS